MATAGTFDIEWHQGDTFSLLLTWRDVNQDPIDLTGYTARMQLRTSFDAEEASLELTTENDRISLGGSNGEIQLTVDAETMADMDTGSYKYDLEMVVGATVRKILKGKFKVLAEVTRGDDE